MSDLEWPPELGERTPAAQRTRNRSYEAALGQTTGDLETELDRLDPDDWTASIANQHTKSNGLPLHNASPDDPGFVLQWSKDGDSFTLGCDAYSRLRDNVRTVYLWFRETRLRSKRPVATADSAFAAAKLPPADEDAIAAPPADSGDELDEEPHEVLGVAPDAPETTIRGAAQALLREDHPDQGGGGEHVRRIQTARDQLLKDGETA